MEKFDIVSRHKKECCGCGVCKKICPKNAIKMCKDEEGFLYPKVDKEKCINCGICIKKCAFLNKKKSEENPIETCYVVKHKNKDVRLNSQSGAIFFACANIILNRNGVIYGCVQDENLNIVHIRAEDEENIKKMCKSKYVQSNIEDCFYKIKQDLIDGRYVLFCGTGCQVEAVINYCRFLNVDMKKLYTIDIICHGVPSPLIYSEYLKWLKGKYGGDVTEFNFRDKSICGWDGHVESAKINGKKYTFTYYREIFHTDLCLRPSCYNCKYTCTKRNSDLTIGDAWGVKTAIPKFNDNMGVSVLLVQSEKGNEMLKEINQTCDVVKEDMKKFLQPNLKKPSVPKGNREQFWNTFYSNGFQQILKEYGTIKFGKRIKSKVKYTIRKILYGKKIYLP